VCWVYTIIQYIVVKQVHLAVAWCCYRRQLCIFSPSQVSSQKTYIGQCATMIFHLCRTKPLWYHKSIDELTLVLKQFNWNLVDSRRFAFWVWLEMKTRKFFNCFIVLYLPYIALSIIQYTFDFNQSQLFFRLIFRPKVELALDAKDVVDQCKKS